MNATVYLRVSTPRQEREGVSMSKPDDEGFQENKCRELCKLRSWEVCGLESDPISGRKVSNRPGLKRAIRSSCESKGVLVVYSLSRLSRSARDMHNICAQLEECGANLASATEAVDTTSAMGRAFFGLLAIFAQLESDQTGERVKAAHGHFKAKLGYTPIGRPPYGYDVADGVRVPVESEQAVLRTIEGLRRKKSTFAEIAAALNLRRLPGPTGSRWHPGSLRRVWLTAQRLGGKAKLSAPSVTE